jgi:hypothetical protein
VSRELLSFFLITAVLTAAAVACGAPGGDVSSGSPEAQATAVQRTAVANIQRIIANNPTATPLPADTATPTPTCQNAIWWTDARSHVGETRTVQGTIVATRPAPGGSVLLEVGQPYPDPTGLAVVVPLAPASTSSTLSGKTVCLAGQITLSEGRPTLLVRDASGIVILN